VMCKMMYGFSIWGISIEGCWRACRGGRDSLIRIIMNAVIMCKHSGLAFVADQSHAIVKD